MKGVVFTELFSMMEQAKGADFVDDLIDACDLPSGGAYTSVGTYDYSEMQALVVQLSKQTGLPLEDLLEQFGTYLFTRFNQLYPNLFEGHTCPLVFLGQIESVIHKEVLKLYPDAELPRFTIMQSSPTSLDLRYQSCRGLAPLANGLIRGCLLHFKKPGTVDMALGNEGLNDVTFKVRLAQ